MNGAEKCIEGCGQDFSCFGKCAADAQTCITGVPTKCGVNAQCKTAMDGLMACTNKHNSACEEIAAGDDDKEDACVYDKCCAEIKAAF